MALITCEDCGKEFSEKASACPNCGCPNSSGVVTTERTSKKWKGMGCAAGFLIVFGAVFAVMGAMSVDVDPSNTTMLTIGAWMLVVGLVLYVYSSFGRWWYHD